MFSILAWVVFGLATSTYAQNNPILQSTLNVEADVSHFNTKTTQSWSVSLLSEYDTNLRPSSSPDRDASSSLILESAYLFSPKTKLYGRVDLIRQFTADQTVKLSDALLVLTPWSWGDSQTRFHPDVSVVLPTDSDQRRDQTYRGTLSLRPTVEFRPRAISWLSFANILFLSRNIHEFTIQRDFTPNVEYSVRERLIVNFHLLKNLKLELINDDVQSWTYSGYHHEDFYFEQDLTYEFVRSWLAVLSHKNEGSIYGPNNHGENVAFYDPKTSYISMAVGHEF